MAERLVISNVPVWQVALSLGLLALSAIAVMWLAGRAFRVHVLLAGQFPKFRDIPRLLKGPAVSHPSDPWNKREGSEAPAHEHKEAHARIGDGGVKLKHHGEPKSLPAAKEAKPIPIVKL